MAFFACPAEAGKFLWLREWVGTMIKYSQIEKFTAEDSGGQVAGLDPTKKKTK
jgi:hypothetical protein